jgi:carbon-monoxide dehydrogenase medium subunit
MKAPAFSYARPSSLGEVLSLMAEHGDGARLLAGGQTLHATLNMRLSEPNILVDLQAVNELKGIQIAGEFLRIGAMVTHTEIDNSPLVAQHQPLLSAAVPHIAHRAIRNLGTFGGSIAYGDPAAEWPACLLALDGIVVAVGPKGQRRIAAQDFFTGLYSTDLQDDELIVACELPLTTGKHAFAFDELARRHGDYAVVGLAATAHVKATGLQHVRLAWLGAVSQPYRSTKTEALLEGQVLSDALITEAIQSLREEMLTEADLTHSAASKSHLAGVMLKRALRTLNQTALAA